MLIIAGCLIVSLAGCLFEPASLSQAWAFLLPAGISAAAGLALRLLAKSDRPLVRHWDALTVVAGWLWGFFIGALPFWLLCQLTPVQALFESVSGWTTTGLSVMDVEAQSRLILFYRSFMQYCGGLGFLLMMAMLIQNRQSAALYAAEGHADWLVPNLMATARTILKIYLLFLAGGILAYLLAGVSFFDALCTTMCALSTGGFANYGASVGHWHSAAISDHHRAHDCRHHQLPDSGTAAQRQIQARIPDHRSPAGNRDSGHRHGRNHPAADGCLRPGLAGGLAGIAL